MPRNERTESRQPVFPLRVGRSRIDNRGLFAKSAIPARRKIGEFWGERITQREARRRARRLEQIAIVETNDGMAIDATGNDCPFRFINHSCAPNAFMRVCGGRVEFYALREIAAGEELTCDYVDSHHNGMRPCSCGSANCRRFI